MKPELWGSANLASRCVLVNPKLSAIESFPIHSVTLCSATPRIYRELTSMLQSSPETGIGGDPAWLSLVGSGQNTGTVMVPRAGNHTQKREKV